jgi:S-adenosylmethionine:tRNA ribosyltransferase-isomerase
MIAANRPGAGGARLLFVDARGAMRHARAADLPVLLKAGDVVVANDAATLPASLHGAHAATGAPVEARLAARVSFDEAVRFTAVLFGAGDHRTRTEDRPAPPAVAPGDRLALGPLTAVVEGTLGNARLVTLRFEGDAGAVWRGLARHGKPIQYAHVPEPLALWDVWTKIAGPPVAFEPPSAAFALDWAMLAALRERGIGFATLTHAASLSSTGDAGLDRLLPFDELYHIPRATTAAIARAKADGGRVIAIGTTVVRALESAADALGVVHAGSGVATLKIGPATRIAVADAILSGVHAAGESHFELLRAFAPDTVLQRAAEALEAARYRNHEFGDFVLIERAEQATATLDRERIVAA